MTEAEAYEALLQHWATAWAVLHPAGPTYIPWITDNEVASSEATWVRVSMVPTVSNQGSLASTPRWIRRGQIAVQLFSPTNVGHGALMRLAGDVRTCLEGRRIPGPNIDAEPLCIYASTTSPASSDGAWHMAVVTLPYRFDEHR